MIPALDIARRIGTGALTPAVAIDAALDTIATREPAIGAFAHLDPAIARAAANATGPLRGITLGVKDIIDTADMPTGMGSDIWAGWRPKADAAVVAMARRAGAAIPGKTTTTAFAHLEPTKTNNPRAPGHTPGGSSSGSAAAVAAGMVALAFGTQTGGSIIRPASFCGVAGIKPSFRLLPTVGVKVFSWALDTVGLFGAGVADVAFGLAALTGRDDLRLKPGEPEPPRLRVVRQAFARDAEPESVEALERALAALKRRGVDIREAELPTPFADAFRAHGVVQDYEAIRALGWEWANARERIPKILADQLEAAQSITPTAYDEARRVAKNGRRALADAFRPGELLITYAAPGAAPAGLGSTGTSEFNRLWTLLGTPCVAVPGFADKAGRPVGIQMVGPFGRDAETLAGAAFVERAIAGAA